MGRYRAGRDRYRTRRHRHRARDRIRSYAHLTRRPRNGTVWLMSSRRASYTRIDGYSSTRSVSRRRRAHHPACAAVTQSRWTRTIAVWSRSRDRAASLAVHDDAHASVHAVRSRHRRLACWPCRSHLPRSWRPPEVSSGARGRSAGQPAAHPGAPTRRHALTCRRGLLDPAPWRRIPTTPAHDLLALLRREQSCPYISGRLVN